MTSLCRDCLTPFDIGARCPACRSPRVLSHPELNSLSIAHMDCDAFYASVEKRDNPALRDVPVIVGGGQRGVVSTCCYLARIHGVRSAMPMFQALKLCPQAVVVKPRMSVYVEVSRQIRAMMEDLTPAIEPLSLDEAFLDLTGTERLHGAPAAVLLATAGAASVELVRGVKKTVPGVLMAGVSVTLTSDGLKQLGDAGSGIAVTMVMPDPNRAKTQLVRDYQAAMRTKGHQDFTLGSLEAYVNMRVLAEGQIGRAHV